MEGPDLALARVGPTAPVVRQGVLRGSLWRCRRWSAAAVVALCSPRHPGRTSAQPLLRSSLVSEYLSRRRSGGIRPPRSLLSTRVLGGSRSRAALLVGLVLRAPSGGCRVGHLPTPALHHRGCRGGIRPGAGSSRTVAGQARPGGRPATFGLPNARAGTCWRPRAVLPVSASAVPAPIAQTSPVAANVKAIRNLVKAHLPANARLGVVSDGNDELLGLPSVAVTPVPRGSDGGRAADVPRNAILGGRPYRVAPRRPHRLSAQPPALSVVDRGARPGRLPRRSLCAGRGHE